MNCQEARKLLHPYADGQLDLVTNLDIEQHIQGCTECAAMHRGVLALRSSFAEGSFYHRAPAGLEGKIRNQIRRTRSEAIGRRFSAGKWFSAAAAVLIVAVALLIVLRGSGGNSNDQLASEVTSAHIRSLMAEHLWDVKSGDQHTVKPWFDGRIDFAPDVRDFKEQGFALEGGRLDYLANRPVAALVYRHDKHEINVFIWPAAGQADEPESVQTRQGYAIIHWVQAGMNYWAISDTSETTLRRLAELVREHPPATR